MSLVSEVEEELDEAAAPTVLIKTGQSPGCCNRDATIQGRKGKFLHHEQSPDPGCDQVPFHIVAVLAPQALPSSQGQSWMVGTFSFQLASQMEGHSGAQARRLSEMTHVAVAPSSLHISLHFATPATEEMGSVISRQTQWYIYACVRRGEMLVANQQVLPP